MTRVIRHVVTTPHFAGGLEKKLPAVRGRLTPNAPLRQFTWLNAGGPAEVLFKPEDKQDLVDFVKACPAEVPVMVMGVTSNTLIRDGGIPGVVVRLGRDFAHIEVRGHEVHAGASAMDMNVATQAAIAGVAGLEFLSGIPGTIGGGLRMNAGAYDGEMKNVLQSAEVLFRDGTVKIMTAGDMGMSYRSNALPGDVVFMSCVLKGTPGDSAVIEQKIMDIKSKRAGTQPIRTKTGGSTFANPPGDKKAWQLIEDAGCRGLMVGQAKMSELHCNFLENTDQAPAADIERLGEEVRRRVFEKSGILLRWEIKRVGIPLEKDTDILEFMKKEEVSHG